MYHQAFEESVINVHCIYKYSVYTMYVHVYTGTCICIIKLLKNQSLIYIVHTSTVYTYMYTGTYMYMCREAFEESVINVHVHVHVSSSF